MAKRKKPSDDDMNQENVDNTNDADNFGLPDIEYKPLDEPKAEEQPVESVSEVPVAEVSEEAAAPEPVMSYQAPEPPKPKYNPSHAFNEEAPKSSATAIITVVIVLVIAVAGFLIYQYVLVPQQEKERQAALAKKEAEDKRLKEESERKAREAEEERKRKEAEAAATVQPAEGTIETLSERTKRYYVVVSSAIDDDLVMDHARQLSAKGVSSKIIPPFGNTKFYRLAIGDYDTFANAQASAEGMKADYGDKVWVLKY